MFKRVGKLFVCALAFALFISVTALSTGQNVKAEADGVAEISMELSSGRIFHCKNEKARLPMASTTKIMTAMIIAEECDLSETITVPVEAVGVAGSSIYLKKDEIISVRDLLYGLMLRSGNDAAVALAIHHSGSVEKFVEHMNAKAAEMGAEDTHFKNPSGLPDDEHYTTAYDLCNIARRALSNQIFKEVVSTKSYSGDYRTYVNKNKLLYSLDGATGVKTGYTVKAGRCLVSSARRNGMEVVCVVLNCYDMFERSALILENCFNKYSKEVISCDRVFNFNGKPCRLDKDYEIITEKGEGITFEIRNNTDGKELNAIAKLEIYCKNNLIFSHNLYTIN